MLTLCLLLTLTYQGQVPSQSATSATPTQQSAAGPEVSSLSKEQILVSAKTVALVGVLGDVAAYGLAMNPSAAKAKEILDKEVKKWGRFTIVDDPAQADLVFILAEGNRAAGGGGVLKTSILLIVPGGTNAGTKKEAYWSEAKTGSMLGVSAGGNVISDFRAYLENLDKQVAKVTLPPGWQILLASPPAPVTQTNSLQGRPSEEQKPLPRPARYVSPYEIMSRGKTYELVGKGPFLEHGTWEKITGIGKYANAIRALEETHAALVDWGRFTEVADPSKADLVFRIYQWDERAESRQFHGVGAAMMIFEGGAAYEREDPGLWISGTTHSSPKEIVAFFREDLEQYEKHQRATSLGEENKDLHRAREKLASAEKKTRDWRNSEFLEAIAEFRKSLRKDPLCVPAHDGLGRALLGINFDAAAAFEFQLVRQSGDASLETLVNLSLAMARIPDQEAAQSAIAEAMAMSSSNAQELAHLGALLYDKHDYNHAIPAYQEAVKRTPADEELLFRLGKAQYQAGKYGEAETSLRGVVQKNPEHKLGVTWLGSTLNRLGRNDEAIPYLRKGVALNPKDDSAHYELSHALATQKNYDEAAAEMRKALEVYPKSPLYHLGLGGILFEARKFREAMPELLEAARLEPDNSQARNALGGCLLAVGMAKEAEEQFAQAIKLDPRSGTLYYNLGQARQDKGDKNGAAEAYRKALELDPTNPKIAEKVEETRE